MKLVSKIVHSQHVRKAYWKLRIHWHLLRTTGLSIGDGSRIGKQVVFETSRSFQGQSFIRIGEFSIIEDRARFEAWGGKIELGREVFIGPNVTIYGQGGVTIGDHSLIAMNCSILSSQHAMPPLGTTIRSQPLIQKPTQIGEDVWLGAGVVVQGGVTIGDGCIVGAGAIVTKDLPPGAVAYGNPAQIRKWRPGAEPLPL